MTEVAFADVLLAEAEDGEVLLSIGNAKTDVGNGQKSPQWISDGFISVPSDKDESGACQVAYMESGYEKIIIASHDDRVTEKTGTLEPGDRAIVSSGDARFLLTDASSTITLYTANSGADGEAMMVQLDGDSGDVQIRNSGTFFRMSKDKITMGINGGGMLTIDKDGVQIDGGTFRCATKGGHLGILAPQSPPAVPAMGVVYGPPDPSGQAPSLSSTSWTVTP